MTRRDRLDLLQMRAAQGLLTPDERREWEELLREMDREEAQALQSAIARLDQSADSAKNELRDLAAQAVELERILGDQLALLKDAEAYLTRMRARRRLIAAEYRRLTGEELAARR